MRTINWAVVGILALVLTAIVGGIGYRLWLHDYWTSRSQKAGGILQWSRPQPSWLVPHLDQRFCAALLSHPESLVIGQQTAAATLDLLTDLPPLKDVLLRGGDAPPGVLEVLARRHRVERLRFVQPVLSAEDAKWLAAMPQLENIEYVGNEPPGTVNDWSWARNRQGLKLRVVLEGATDHDLRELSHCPGLEWLNVSGEALTAASLKTLADHPRLGVLEIASNSLLLIPDEIQWPRGLGSLRLHCPQATDAVLKTLSTLPHMEELELHGGQVTDGGMIALAQLPALSVLTLDDLPVTDVGMEVLSHSHRLTRVTLNGTHVSAAGIVDLSGMRQWRRFLVNGVRFDSNPPSKPLLIEAVRIRLRAK